MSTNKKDLITSSDQSFQEPALKFYPYLLVEIGYSSSDRPAEGVLLWSQTDGELITDTENWATTLGFENLISHNATGSDYKIIKALAANQGAMKREQLQTYLSISPHTADDWIQSAREKRLISQRGNQYVLTQKDMNIDVQPQTKINQWLSTKPYSHAYREPTRFDTNAIKNAIHNAFGNELSIHCIREVYLPIYNIGVVYPDGTVRTTAWNALNGQPLKRTTKQG